VQHCLAHGEDDFQQLEQDYDTVAGPCDFTAENVVVGLTDGNAEMVCYYYYYFRYYAAQ